MLKFRQVTMQNFMAYGNKPTTVRLDTQETVLVRGDNRDVGEEGSSANGAGKSNSMQSVCYALFGNDVSGNLRQDDMINFVNEKAMVVTLELEVDGADYVISRGRKPNFVTLKSGKEDLTRDSMKNTDQSIIELIGMSYDTFLMSYLMSNSVTPFMAKKPAEQRKFMEDILGLTLLTERANTLKVLRKDLEAEKRVTERELENAQRDNEKLKESIQKALEASKAFEQTKQEKLSLLEQEIDDAHVDPEKVKEWRAVFQKIKELGEEIAQKEREEKELETRFREKERETFQLDKQITAIQTKGESLEKEIERLTVEADEAESKHAQLYAQKEKHEYFLYALNQIERLRNALDPLEKREVEIEKHLTQMDKQSEKVQSELAHLEDETCPYCAQHFSNEESKQKITALRAEYDELVEKIDIMEQEGADVVAKQDEAQSELAKFTDDEKAYTQQQYDRFRMEIDNAYEKRESLLNQLDEAHKSLEESKGESADGLAERKAQIDKELDDMEKTYASMEETHDGLNDQLATERAKVERDGLRDERDIDVRLEKEERLRAQYDETERQQNPYEGQVETYQGQMKDVDELANQVATMTKEETHYGYLIKLLTSSKSFIRQGIIDQYVGFLNKKINEYAQKLGLPHVAQVNPDLTVDIEYMRRSVGYFNMSAGERLRLDVSTSIAMRELLSMMGVKCNLLMVDEVLDGAIDASGLKQMYTMLKGYCDHVMLISHRDDFQSMVDRVVTIRKQNGFSTYDA